MQYKPLKHTFFEMFHINNILGATGGMIEDKEHTL